MKIEDYAPYFHDGELVAIYHSKNEIELTLESFTLDFELDNDVMPSERRTLRGKLHLNGIQSVIRENVIVKNLKFNWDSCEILDLIINNNKVKLLVSWSNYPPKKRDICTEQIEIIAEQVYWENIPNLYIPDSDEELIDIHPYLSYFKAGNFIGFEYKNDILKLSLESHFVKPDDFRDKIFIYRNALRGKLMIEKLKLSKKNGENYSIPSEEFRLGKIAEIEIYKTKVLIKIGWKKEHTTDVFEFEGERITFLTLPLLFNPFIHES